MPRKDFPTSVMTSVLMRCKRRCALCYGLDNDFGIKRGQLAHIDRNATNNEEGNAAYLCSAQHDLYDSTSRQTKTYTPGELKGHQDNLLAYVLTIRTRTRRETVKRTLNVKHARVTLDIYDRRLPTYRIARQFIRDVCENLKPELQQLFKFAADTDEALFLYDESIAGYLELLFKKALRLRTLALLKERMYTHPDESQNYQEIMREESALAVWFTTQPEESRARFAPFLRLA